MLASLSLIFLVGLSLSAICEKIHLPRIVGMIVTGILLGPLRRAFLEITHHFSPPSFAIRFLMRLWIRRPLLLIACTFE